MFKMVVYYRLMRFNGMAIGSLFLNCMMNSNPSISIQFKRGAILTLA